MRALSVNFTPGTASQPQARNPVRRLARLAAAVAVAALLIPGGGTGRAAAAPPAGDEVWLDRSWDAGASWPGGSSLGRVGVPARAASTRTRAFNTADPVSRLYGGAVRACGRAVEGQSGSCTAWARPAADTAQTGDQRYAWAVNRAFETDKAAFPAGVRSSDAIDGHFISRAIDDAQWWAPAWISAYDLTGDSVYLAEAVTVADYVGGFWDTGACGGGVWWDRERTYKNAVTNGQYVRLTAALHNRLAGDVDWLARSRTAWQWFAASGLINGSGLSCNGTAAQRWTFARDGSVRALGRCVEVKDSGAADGARLQQRACTGAAKQRWRRG